MNKITMTLDTAGIDKAHKELLEYRKKFENNLAMFINALTDRGAEIAIQNTAFIGDLPETIQTIMYIEQRKGIIFSSAPWAAFVEFGTGVKGSESPHPVMPWEYDVNEHGKEGWVYFDEKQNRFRWTAGMPSRPFMYNTIQELAKEAESIAKGVFANG